MLKHQLHSVSQEVAVYASTLFQKRLCLCIPAPSASVYLFSISITHTPSPSVYLFSLSIANNPSAYLVSIYRTYVLGKRDDLDNAIATKGKTTSQIY